MDLSEVFFFFSWKKKKPMHTFPASQEENCFQKYNLQVNVKVLFLEKVYLNQIELNSITVLNKINLSYA